METNAEEPLDEQLDALLDAARPTPDRHWVRSTEQRLLPPGKRASAWWRPSRATRLASGLAAGVACVALALALVGEGPVGAGDPPAEADDGCRLVQVKKQERVPRLTVGRDGAPRIKYSLRTVERSVRRCR